MDTCQEFLTIKELVELRKADMLKPNPEYQRGVVWTRNQQRKLIDSVMRGYQLPIIYLHYIKKVVANMTNESYEIIDGQQRIESLRFFVEGAFRLYNVNDSEARFPQFLQDQPCPWGGKLFQELADELKDKLLETKLPIAYIQTGDSNEVRDLFVRLQGGAPLAAQEKRDSYPGQFTDFILRLGGKPEIPRYPGHDFFQRALKMKPGQDRGKTRQLAAQIAMLFLERHNRGADNFCDINSRTIDDYYYTHLDFDSESDECKRLWDILSKLDNLLGDGKRPKLLGHNAIHLVLLLDSIWDDYTRSWEDTLPQAYDNFSSILAKATKTKNDENPEEAWLQYGVRTRSNSDRGDTIRLRHQYYVKRMSELIGNLTPKDPNRTFGQLEREIIYWRDDKKCRVPQCLGEVVWSDAEIHHVKEHSKGGQTELVNGALVHRQCHPKGEAAKEFAKHWSR